MHDSLSQSHDDVSAKYLDRRASSVDDEALMWLLSDEVEAATAHTAPVSEPVEPPKDEMPSSRSVNGALEAAGKAAMDIAKGVAVEGPRAVVGGVRDAGQEVLDAIHSMDAWGDEWLRNEMGVDLGTITVDGEGIRWEQGGKPHDEITLPEVGAPDTVTGGIIHDTAQFLVGFVPALRAAKAAKVGTGAAKAVGAGAKAIGKNGAKASAAATTFAEASAAGAVADATVFDPYEERLAHLVQKHPSLQNPITEYLATSPDDSESTARFKAALEGLGLGVVTEGLVGAVRVLRGVRSRKPKAQEASVDVTGEDVLATAGSEIPPATKSELIEESYEEVLPGLGDFDAPLVSMVDAGTAEKTALEIGSPTAAQLRKHAPIDVIDIPADDLKTRNMPLREARDVVMQSAMDESTGIRGTYVNKDADISIDVGRKGIKKTISETNNRTDLELVAKIPELIEKAIHVETRASTRGKQTIPNIRRFYGAAHVDGATHRVKITVRKTQQGDKYYNLEAVEIEGPDVVVNGDTPGQKSTIRPSGQSGTINVDTLLADVKRDTDGLPVLEDIQSNGFAANVNLSKIDEPEDVTEALRVVSNRFAGDMDEAARGVISHEETAKLASDLGMTAEELLKRRRGQAFNAEEALAAWQILASSGEQLTALAKKAATVDASPADVLAFRRALSIHSGIQAQVSGMTAEAGRALQSFKILAKGAADRDRMIKEMIDGHGGDIFNRDIAQRLADIASENPEMLNKAAREMERVSGWDQMYEVWVNNLLSGPQTHAVNILSNTLVAAWSIPERYVASKIGKLLGGDGVQAGEATAQAFGLVNGAKDGLRLAAKALRNGESSDLIGKIEQPYRALTADNFIGTKAGRAINKITAGSLENGGIAARGVDLLGEVARVPSRFLTAEDEFFKSIGYRMELQAQAYRTALSEGLEGDEMARRIADILANPPENIHMSAVDAARYQTFTKPLGEAGRSAQKAIRMVPGLRLVAPFIRTPTNILKYVGERTPLAMLSKNIRADVAAGGARRDLALAKIGLGTMVMGVAADMTAGGSLTGGGPSDPQMRQHLRNTGWQPYSLKIGDTYYSYNRLDPLGMQLGLAADTAEIMGQMYGDDYDGDVSIDDLALASAASLSKNVTSKTWMSGVSNLIETMEDPDRNATRFFQRFAGTLIPTGVAQANRAFNDPVLRDTKAIEPWQAMVNQVKSRLPGYSEDLPPRTNVWGEPIVLSGGLGPDIVSPVYTSSGVSSPVDDELMRLGMPINMPSRQIGGIELTPHEYHRFVVLAGNEAKDPNTGLGFKDTLELLINGTHPLSSAYQNATDGDDGGKALMIRQIEKGYRELARVQMLQNSQELNDLVTRARIERAQALQQQR